MKGGMDGETFTSCSAPRVVGVRIHMIPSAFRARLFALIAPPLLLGNALGVAIGCLFWVCWGVLLAFRTSQVNHV
jgi:hypothetical protein